MTTCPTRRHDAHPRGRPHGPRAHVLVAAAAVPVLLLGACSGEQGPSTDDRAGASGETTNDAAAGPEADPAPVADTGRSLPPNMPAGIPIPDEHMVLRTTSITGAEAEGELGEHVAVNVAIGGDVEEQRAFYEAELRAAYGDVTVEDGVLGEALRFRGEWFENGRVFVSENEGHLDNDAIDSSHLPAMLTVQVWEHMEE